MVACLIFLGAHSNYFKFVLNFHHMIGIPIKKQFKNMMVLIFTTIYMLLGLRIATHYQQWFSFLLCVPIWLSIIHDFYSFLYIINFHIIEFQTFVIYAPACEKIKETNIRKKYLYFNKIRLWDKKAPTGARMLNYESNNVKCIAR